MLARPVAQTCPPGDVCEHQRRLGGACTIASRDKAGASCFEHILALVTAEELRLSEAQQHLRPPWIILRHEGQRLGVVALSLWKRIELCSPIARLSERFPRAWSELADVSACGPF